MTNCGHPSRKAAYDSKIKHCKVGQARGLRGTLSPAHPHSPASARADPPTHREAALASQYGRKSLQTSLTQALSTIYRHRPGRKPESSVQHSNLPYNQGNQQFDGRQWYRLTVINYTGII